MIKIIGFVFVICGCFTFSYSNFENEKKKIIIIENFIKLITYTKNRIDLYAEPICDILSSKSAEIKEDFSISKEIISFSELILFEKQFLGSREIIVLQDFSESLGKSYRSQQVKICESTVNELVKIKSEISRKMKIKVKGNTAIFCLLAGIVFILLL